MLLGVVVGCDPSPKSGSNNAAEKQVPKAAKPLSITASGAYMRETAPGQTRAAVYLTLENHGDVARKINLISTDIAGYAEVHNHIHQDGMMKMREVKHPVVAPRARMDFRPGGYHVMLFDVAERPVAGSVFELQIELDQAESLTVPVKVEPVK